MSGALLGDLGEASHELISRARIRPDSCVKILPFLSVCDQLQFSSKFDRQNLIVQAVGNRELTEQYLQKMPRKHIGKSPTESRVALNQICGQIHSYRALEISNRSIRSKQTGVLVHSIELVEELLNRTVLLAVEVG